jgi:PTS system nitrogen regulatory IIA component
MNIAELVTSKHIIAGLRVSDKKQLLQELAHRAAEDLHSDVQPILEALQAREKLGSTGLGQGFALPHACLAGLPGFFGLFARLNRAVEYQAVDEMPVDLVFLLLIPENAAGEHVAALAAISRRFRDPEFTARVRKAKNADAIYGLLAGTQ